MQNFQLVNVWFNIGLHSSFSYSSFIQSPKIHPVEIGNHFQPSPDHLFTHSGIGQMERSFAKELYADSLGVPKPDSTSSLNLSDADEDSLWYEDGSEWDDPDRRLAESSDLDREWQRRHDQFHTAGYRDGLIAGKEASAQEGFNIGYKQGVNWGVVRGVTSVLACLPEGLKERLTGTEEKRESFHKLYDSVQSLSTSDALKLFNDAVISAKTSDNAVSTKHKVGSEEQTPESSSLDSYLREFKVLLLECPAIKVHLDEDVHN